MSPRLRAGAASLALLAAFTSLALAQTPFWQPQPQQPQQPAPATPPARRTPIPAQAAPPATAVPATPRPATAVIARIGGRPLTQSDFDRIAVPYFARMRAQYGKGFEGDIVKIANHNVLDELLRRELLRIESQRMKIVPTAADIDTVLSRDPYFWQSGRFDAAKFADYKTNPQSNYPQMLPELRELAAMDLLDKRLRERMTPSPAAVRAEWAKRNDQVKFHSFAVLQRDISLEPESTAPEWQAYYDGHKDQFRRRTRVRLRYVRLPLPAATDTTRAAEEGKATAQAQALLDSLEKKQIPDTSSRLFDSGMIEALAANIPAIGFSPELQSAIGRADSVGSVKSIGPLTVGDAVVAGLLTEREPAHVPPLREVLADVKRQADVEKRRTQAEADRRAYWEAHAAEFRTTRMRVSRIVVPDDAIPTRQVTSADYAAWWADNWRQMTATTDPSRTQPPFADSLKTRFRAAVLRSIRPASIDAAMAKLAAALKNAKDPRAAVRSAGIAGAVAETLTFVRGVTNDSLFVNPVVEDYYRAAPSKIGVVQGPESAGNRHVVWRVDAADSAFVLPFDQARMRVETAFREAQRQQDEAEARTWFEPRKAKYRTPVRYGLDVVRVRVQPADSVKVTDTELQRAYDRGKDRFRQEEQVHARHLLIMPRSNDAGEMAHAKQRADSLLKAVKGGADFVDLCKRFSQEPGAPSSAGDLGWFGRGRMVKEFETAAFAMQPGQLSDVVQTQFGYHIIRVEERKAAGVRPFDEVRAELRTEIASARADTSAKRAAQALRRKLAAGGDATVLARPYGGMQRPDPIGVNDPVPGIGFVQGLAAALPGLGAGRWSSGTYRAGNDYVLVRLRQKQLPRPATFDDVKQQAIDDMKAAKRQDLLERKVADIRAALAAGQSPDSVAAPYGGLKEASPVTANAAFVPTLGFGPHIMPKILKLKPGQLSDSLSTPLGVMWVRLDQRVAADPAGFASARSQLQQEMIVTAMNEWLEKEKKSVRIEVLRADLREPKPGPYKTVTLGGS